MLKDRLDRVVGRALAPVAGALALRPEDAQVCAACRHTPFDGHGVGVVAASMATGGQHPTGAWICEECVANACANRQHGAALGQVVLLLAGRL